MWDLPCATASEGIALRWAELLLSQIMDGAATPPYRSQMEQ